MPFDLVFDYHEAYPYIAKTMMFKGNQLTVFANFEVRLFKKYMIVRAQIVEDFGYKQKSSINPSPQFSVFRQNW
jgi:hypothetical protein